MYIADLAPETATARRAPVPAFVRSDSELRASLAKFGGRTGPIGIREAGALRLRFPRVGGACEGVIVNTSGGIAGGDRQLISFSVGEGATAAITTQSAEKVYGSDGEAATIDTTLDLAADARFAWLPQETILFDGAALCRRIEADLAADARLLAVESVILGREAMGETVEQARLKDRWRIRVDGRLIFADDLGFDGAPPASRATLGEARAFATVVLVSPEAEALVARARTLIGENGSASAWSGKLVARLCARDGFLLRKSLVPALTLLGGGAALPKTWSL